MIYYLLPPEPDRSDRFSDDRLSDERLRLPSSLRLLTDDSLLLLRMELDESSPERPLRLSKDESLLLRLLLERVEEDTSFPERFLRFSDDASDERLRSLPVDPSADRSLRLEFVAELRSLRLRVLVEKSSSKRRRPSDDTPDERPRSLPDEISLELRILRFDPEKLLLGFVSHAQHNERLCMITSIFTANLCLAARTEEAQALISHPNPNKYYDTAYEVNTATYSSMGGVNCRNIKVVAGQDKLWEQLVSGDSDLIFAVRECAEYHIRNDRLGKEYQIYNLKEKAAK